jgi:hypothetical protein
VTHQRRLFVSYARADELLALRFCALLGAAGQDVWLDLTHLRSSPDWWNEVRRAIDQSAGVLFLVSNESSRSLSCSRELTHAAARGKPIVPIKTEPATEASAWVGHGRWDTGGPRPGLAVRPCRAIRDEVFCSHVVSWRNEPWS